MYPFMKTAVSESLIVYAAGFLQLPFDSVRWDSQYDTLAALIFVQAWNVPYIERDL